MRLTRVLPLLSDIVCSYGPEWANSRLHTSNKHSLLCPTRRISTHSPGSRAAYVLTILRRAPHYLRCFLARPLTALIPLPLNRLPCRLRTCATRPTSSPRLLSMPCLPPWLRKLCSASSATLSGMRSLASTQIALVHRDQRGMLRKSGRYSRARLSSVSSMLSPSQPIPNPLCPWLPAKRLALHGCRQGRRRLIKPSLGHRLAWRRCLMACASELTLTTSCINTPRSLARSFTSERRMKEEDSPDASQKQKQLNVLWSVTPWLSVFARYLLLLPILRRIVF
jgi:hypothetical protein